MAWDFLSRQTTAVPDAAPATTATGSMGPLFVIAESGMQIPSMPVAIPQILVVAATRTSFSGSFSSG
ncbi:MAG: hypothetical protein KME26_32410 [Oscillatoria princeps RMCB-10]|nr:hypothetical protein [Oscillatoria princeps RMCB-10]